MYIRFINTALYLPSLIHSDESLYYEDYLRELINESNFFLNLSNGEKYEKPLSESNGECDCITASYPIDCKLMGSTSYMQGKRELSEQIYEKNGVSYLTAPMAEGSQTATNLYGSLENLSIDDLNEIADNNQCDDLLKKDVKKYLKVLRTNKNILLFLPVEFLVNEDNPAFDSVAEEMINSISTRLKASMEYRLTYVQEHNVFLCFVYQEFMIFLMYNKDKFEFADKVLLKKSPTYNKIIRGYSII